MFLSKRRQSYEHLTIYEIWELNARLLDKIKSELGDKYRLIIYEKNYSLNNFERVIKREILKFSFIKNPFYDKLFKILEKKFLQEISDYPDKVLHGMISEPEINYLSNNYVIDKGIKKKLQKLSIRQMVLNEHKLSPLDKYKLRSKTPRKESKNERMKSYSSTIYNKIK